jgi:hypothetical protein
MPITRTEAERWLHKVRQAKELLDQRWDDLHSLVGATPDSALGTAVWLPVQLLMNCVSELIGDKTGAVNWFFWENDGGKSGLQHSLPNGELKKIKTISDLLDVIGLVDK